MILWTYDWVPEGPRGFVRDLRLRWALEEAGLAYEVKTVPFHGRGAAHLARQPFAQVPFLDDGDVKIFESGACLLHLGKKSDRLMPRDAQGEAEVTQWVIAALNSIEMVSVPWWFLKISGDADNGLTGWLTNRLERLEPVLAEREWLAAEQFTIADLLMADVLRLPRRHGALETFPAALAYIDRVLARPAFEKARVAQLAHFAAADEMRKGPAD